MSEVRLVPHGRLGFNFPSAPPFGTTESDWRALKSEEIQVLESSGNLADSWSNIRVREGFDPARVLNCRFFGAVRIGALSPSLLEHHDLKLPVGLERCTIVACDIGDDVALINIGYMAHMAVENHCILFNVNEIVTTDHAKFGNGVVMDGEDEDVRIWLEIANENAGRRVLPFDGLLPADAWIWAKYRDDQMLQERFVTMTDGVKDFRCGSYGSIGKETVIKNCRILKDIRIGRAAYIKGCNKLKNLTINSDDERPTQLGEGCELVNGIIGYGCRVFYGVKAVRFVLCDHSNLKYGARLINSVLGSNSTISCCEVLNSLLFGAHEQHHNSSFLCASVLKGQTNMASAATVGSNHNSRSADGEIVADRGFWPGLSVSLKHNSRFAAFCLIAKGSYPAELDIPLPFSLVSNDETAGELHLMPGYWFRYNMYALARNAVKTEVRDQRIVKHQCLEFDWLAPDTVDQMRKARQILEDWAAESPQVRDGSFASGLELLISDENANLIAKGGHQIEAGRRLVRIIRAGRAWKDYGRLIRFYAVRTLIENDNGLVLHDEDAVNPGPWENVGGQLILQSDLESLKEDVKQKIVEDWRGMHKAYRRIGSLYEERRRTHARFVLSEMRSHGDLGIVELLEEAKATSEFLTEGIRDSRRKDYENPFRNITYETTQERDAVMGRFEDDSVVRSAKEDHQRFIQRIEALTL